MLLNKQILILFITSFLSIVQGVTLTYRMSPHEKACFYTVAEKPNDKIAFYFAVQSGGSFDIDWVITSPKSEIIRSGNKERQTDLVFSARIPGEHSFCFSNTMSTFAEKVLDFDITSEHETQPDHPSNQNPLPGVQEQKEIAKKKLTPSEASLNVIEGKLNAFVREQKYYRTRENRNFDTVASTEHRVFWFSLVESILIVGMACVQVFVIQTFFANTGKSRV